MPNKKPTAKKPAPKTKVSVTRKVPLKTKILIALIVAAVIGLAIYIAWDVTTDGPLTQVFQNRDELAAYVRSYGLLAPLAYLLLQIAQTVFAPIPGNIVGGVGGFIFGWWGVLWTLIGSLIGFWIVFAISRKFGRPLVEKIIKKENLEKFDFIIGKRAPLILFVVFLIPGLPDDIVAYIAGLTEVKIKHLLALVALGRLPSVVATNYIGMGLGAGNARLAGAIALGVVVVLGVIFWQRKRLLGWVQKLSGTSANTDSVATNESRPVESSKSVKPEQAKSEPKPSANLRKTDTTKSMLAEKPKKKA